MPKLSKRATAYMKRIWGIANVQALDPLVIEDIKENAAEPENVLDRQILEQLPPRLYFVCDRNEECRVVVRAYHPFHAAMIGAEVFHEENEHPFNDTVAVHDMGEPGDGEPGCTGAVLIWSAVAGEFVVQKGEVLHQVPMN